MEKEAIEKQRGINKNQVQQDNVQNIYRINPIQISSSNQKEGKKQYHHNIQTY